MSCDYVPWAPSVPLVHKRTLSGLGRSLSLSLESSPLQRERERWKTLSLRRRRAVESEKEETRTKYILCIFGGRRLGARRFLPFFHARTHRPVVVIENYTVSCPNLALTHRSGRALAHAHTRTRARRPARRTSERTKPKSKRAEPSRQFSVLRSVCGCKKGENVTGKKPVNKLLLIEW